MAELVLPGILKLLQEPEAPWAAKLLWHHCRDPRGCYGPSGMPDLIIIGPRGGLWVEVKPHRGSRLRPEQTTWRYALLAIGWQHVVWVGEDLDSGYIRTVLEAML
jgi:hypothetical protein